METQAITVVILNVRAVALLYLCNCFVEVKQYFTIFGLVFLEFRP